MCQENETQATEEECSNFGFKLKSKATLVWFASFLCLDCYLFFALSQASISESRLIKHFAQAFPLSQCTLVAIWCATNSRRQLTSLPRLSAFSWQLLICTVVVWLCVALMFRLSTKWFDGAIQLAWILLFVVHTVVVLVTIRIYHIRQVDQRLRINIQSMLIWTCIAAVGLSLARYGATHWGWTTNIFFNSFMASFLALAFLTAGSSVMMLWAYLARHSRQMLSRMLCMVLTTALVVYLFVFFADRRVSVIPFHYWDTIELLFLHLGIVSVPLASVQFQKSVFTSNVKLMN